MVSFEACELYDESEPNERRPTAWSIERAFTTLDDLELGVCCGELDDSGSEFLPGARDGSVLSWGIWPSNTWMKNSRRTPKTWTHSQRSLICLGAVENRMAIGARRTKSTVWWVAVYFLLFTASILSPTGIQAHPHVFIVQRINAVFDIIILLGFMSVWTSPAWTHNPFASKRTNSVKVQNHAKPQAYFYSSVG